MENESSYRLRHSLCCLISRCALACDNRTKVHLLTLWGRSGSVLNAIVVKDLSGVKDAMLPSVRKLLLIPDDSHLHSNMSKFAPRPPTSLCSTNNIIRSYKGILTVRALVTSQRSIWLVGGVNKPKRLYLGQTTQRHAHGAECDTLFVVLVCASPSNRVSMCATACRTRWVKLCAHTSDHGSNSLHGVACQSLNKHHRNYSN